MKKLKCWKKVKGIEGSIWNESGKKGVYPYLFAGRGYHNTAERDWKKRYPYQVGLVNYTSQKTIEDKIDTKGQAIEIAQKFMEENDSC